MANNTPSSTPQIDLILYRADASAYYAAVRDLPLPVWLDSGAGSVSAGAFDLISAAPLAQLTWDGAAAFDFSQLGKLQSALSPLPAQAQIPFLGGCIGTISYEANHGWHGLDLPRTPLLPLIQVGLYSWALVQHHPSRQAWLVFHPQADDALKKAIRQRLARAQSTSGNVPLTGAFQLAGAFRASTTKPDFLEHIERIRTYIQAGDCYQVNYAQHFCAGFAGDPFAAYLALRQLSPTPLAAFMEQPTGAVLSLSPERFLQLRQSQVHSFPIKGTTPRHADPHQDRANRERLRDSLKDHAENLMIVDLMRNDLSRVCRPGSVEAPRLFELQSFPTVHHLVSEVRGELAAGQDVPDLLHHCLPGGSITGAPKRRAMQIIAELEPIQRSLYCGSIFYWSRCGTMDSSIAIRTLVATESQLHCWGGGGITADSQAKEEYQETLDKVRPLMQRLEELFL